MSARPIQPVADQARDESHPAHHAILAASRAVAIERVWSAVGSVLMTSLTSSPRRRANAFGGLAVAWGIGLIVVAVTVPMYGSQTLVNINGDGVLGVMSAPAILSAVAWFALAQRWDHGRRAAGWVAWACVWLLGAICVLGILSIGIYVMPAFVLLIVAVSPVQLGPP